MKALPRVKKDKFHDHTYEKLNTTDGLISEIHKENEPLRPIVSSVSSPTYELSISIEILSALVGNSACHIRNTQD